MNLPAVLELLKNRVPTPLVMMSAMLPLMTMPAPLKIRALLLMVKL